MVKPDAILCNHHQPPLLLFLTHTLSHAYLLSHSPSNPTVSSQIHSLFSLVTLPASSKPSTLTLPPIPMTILTPLPPSPPHTPSPPPFEKSPPHPLSSLSDSRRIAETDSFFPALTSIDSAFNSSTSFAESSPKPSSRLELRRVALYPGGDAESEADGVVILVGHFNMPAGLRAVETAISDLQVKVVPECKAIVLPMVKQPFVVGFLVAELPLVELETNEKPKSDGQNNRGSGEEVYSLPPFLDLDKKSWEIQTLRVKDEPVGMRNFTSEQRSIAVDISQSLAMAYVMDQKAMLLQQSTWQNNIRMSNLVEQIRGPLSSIQTLSKILSTQTKKSQISYDIVEDISVQGDRLNDVLQQLQDAVYLTKANIMRYNEEAIKKMNGSNHILAESVRSQLLDSSPRVDSANKTNKSGEPLSFSAAAQDIEMPLPPLALAPLRHGIRPCNVSEVLVDLVDTIRPLAHNQKCAIELSQFSSPFLAAVEEPALRQAFSNLIEGALLRTRVGGRVGIVSTAAPAGGTLVLIDDDGPDMHYMMQTHSLTPYGQELLSEDMVEDNMTWNFVAGMTIAREILESYGCVVRIISPWTKDAPLGAGGTRVELWLPSVVVKSDTSSQAQEV